MIIQLKNFGPIEFFEFDTDKDMHFIFGENNIGKSYAISAVYLILKNWNLFIDELNEDKEYLAKTIHNLELSRVDENKNSVIQSVFDKTIQNKFTSKVEKSFSNSYSSIGELINKKNKEVFKIIINTHDFTIEITQNDEGLYSHFIPLNKNSALEKAITSDKYSLQTTDFINTLKNSNDIQSLYFLPASRSGIYSVLSGFTGLIVQLTQFRNEVPTLKFEIPNLSEPLADYYLNISNIKEKAYNTPFSWFAKEMEANIIKGKINFDKLNHKLYYEPINLDLSLELSEVSSMISEIASIIAYLKFIIKYNENGESKGDNYLFIEEPEAHLHPKIQVELIKLFAEMAKKGLKVVMTSHSNYMFNKLSNMILAKEIDPNTITVAHMKLGEKGSYIDKNSMHVDEFGIEDNNFADVAEELYMERLKLYEQTP